MSPSQQNSWLLGVQHTLCLTDKPTRKTGFCQRKWKKKLPKNKQTNYVQEIEISKILEIYGWIFFPANNYSLLESCQLYVIAKYKASSCCKIEAVIQRCSVKKAFLKILQNLQENPCARVSFLIKLQLKKRLWHRCFPVNIAKFLRILFLKLEPSLWN